MKVYEVKFHRTINKKLHISIIAVSRLYLILIFLIRKNRPPIGSFQHQLQLLVYSVLSFRYHEEYYFQM